MQRCLCITIKKYLFPSLSLPLLQVWRTLHKSASCLSPPCLLHFKSYFVVFGCSPFRDSISHETKMGDIKLFLFAIELHMCEYTQEDKCTFWLQLRQSSTINLSVNLNYEKSSNDHFSAHHRWVVVTKMSALKTCCRL